jgi:hypothetical protein
MAHEVSGVSLESLEDPIRDALMAYSTATDGEVWFEFDAAALLEPTTEKPNSARSVTKVFYGRDVAAPLYVIAFAPEDATGDDKTYKDGQINTGVFLPNPKYFPRSKAGIHSEAHLALVAKQIESSNDPVLFAGHLSVLELLNNTITETTYVGQESHAFAANMASGRKMKPVTTLTTGFEYAVNNPGSPGDRFGDPHAILNRTNALQVCAFIAITNEAAAQHLDVLRLLGASKPQSC